MTITTFAEAEAIMAGLLPGYEPRPPQQRLAQAVEGVSRRPLGGRPRHLIAQAGCGVGKSLGYAIPAILSGKRVVISVTTKSLQDQLANKDLPFLETVLPPFTWTILKGRSNYLCLNRAVQAEEDRAPDLARIMRYAETRAGDPSFDGTRESFDFVIDPIQWSQVCSDSDECRDLKCRDSDGCWAEAAKDKARNSRIIVVNHALLAMDLMLRSLGLEDGMLEGYDLVVLDESHDAEEAIGNVLGGRLTEESLRRLTTTARSWVSKNSTSSVEVLHSSSIDLLGGAKAIFDALPTGRVTPGAMDSLADEFGRFWDAVEDYQRAFKGTLPKEGLDVRDVNARKSLLRRISNVRNFIRALVSDSWSETVRWVEHETDRKGEVRRIIRTAPISVAPFLGAHLFSQVPVVLVSATLAVNGTFDYIASRLGIEDYDGLDVGTPFDFTTQALLYVPRNIPEPLGAKINVWQTMASEEIVDLIRASRGRALVLFTSVAHMRSTYASVYRRVPYTVKMQGQEPNASLAAWFSQETSGVLFGVKSFFTGVDFQGETLSLVIIAKMPFPVPNEPITEARCEVIEANGGSAFFNYSVPVMSLTLQQAVGRLIRHREDTGVVAILDPRVVTKGYGKKVLRDLPPMSMSHSLDDVVGWFERTG